MAEAAARYSASIVGDLHGFPTPNVFHTSVEVSLVACHVPTRPAPAEAVDGSNVSASRGRRFRRRVHGVGPVFRAAHKAISAKVNGSCATVIDQLGLAGIVG